MTRHNGRLHCSGSKKRGLHKEYLRNTDSMPRRVRLELIETLINEELTSPVPLRKSRQTGQGQRNDGKIDVSILYMRVEII